MALPNKATLLLAEERQVQLVRAVGRARRYVRRLVVGGQELVPRFEGLREIDDLIEVGADPREAFSDTSHGHRGHAPDSSFDGAALDGSARKVVNG